MDRLAEIEKASEKKSQPKEATLNSAALSKLNKLPGCVAFKHRGSPYAVAGHADIYGCIKGFAFFLEGKLPGKKPRPNQELFLEKVGTAGAITGVYNTAEEAVDIVVNGLKTKLEEKNAQG